MPTFSRVALAGAALLLVGAAVAACGDGDGGGDAVPATDAEGGATSGSDGTTTAGTDATPSTGDDTAGGDDTTTSAGEGNGGAGEGEGTDRAIAAVDRYIEAVAAGDLEAAWDLVDPRSRDAVGGFEGFEDLRSGLAEGIGAWAEAEDRRELVGSVGPVDGAEVWPVTLLGTVAQEGPPALAATSVLTRIGPDGVTVSPFEDPFGDLVFPTFDPVEGSDVSADEAVIIRLPVELTPTLIAVDAVPARFEELQRPDTGGELASLVIAGLGVEAGPHAVTVVVTADDGAMAALAAAYTVTAGPSAAAGGTGHTGDRPADPSSAARAVFDAWSTGDLASARELTNLDAYAVLSSRPPAPADRWASEPTCEGAAGSTYCAWERGGEQLILRVSNAALGEGTGPPVVEARFEPIA